MASCLLNDEVTRYQVDSLASAIAREYHARLPGLADTFEQDGSQMHVTQTLDYAIILDGQLWLELDDGSVECFALAKAGGKVTI